MAEKAWYEKLLKSNPNLTLDDIIKYKIAEVAELSEQVIADKVEKLKDGIKKGILPEEALETGEKKAREEAEKNHYRYDLDSIASRIERDCPALLQDHEGNPIEARKFLDDLLVDPSTALALPSSAEPLVEFFSIQFGIPIDTMRAIVLKKWSPTHTHAVRRRKAPEPVVPRVEDPLPSPVAETASPGARITVRNASDHSHVLKVLRAPNGDIQITLLPDERVRDIDKAAGAKFIHSRRRVLLYTEGNPSFPEYDTGTVSVTCE